MKFSGPVDIDATSFPHVVRMCFTAQTPTTTSMLFFGTLCIWRSRRMRLPVVVRLRIFALQSSLLLLSRVARALFRRFKQERWRCLGVSGAVCLEWAAAWCSTRRSVKRGISDPVVFFSLRLYSRESTTVDYKEAGGEAWAVKHTHEKLIISFSLRELFTLASCLLSS